MTGGLAKIRACIHTYEATKEAARARLCYLRLIKTTTIARIRAGESPWSSRTNVSSSPDSPPCQAPSTTELHRAFVDRTLEANLTATSKAVVGASYAKITREKADKKTEPAAEKRKRQHDAASAAAAAKK